jgi:UDP-2,3-diacylglucosamine hydrolase
MNTSSTPEALFVSDAHFHLRPDGAENRRVDRFVAWLDGAAGVGHLILLGDVFDFWFDYPHFRMRGYERVLQALDRVRAAGTRIHFVGGNHDIWAARYLHERYGSEPDGQPTTIELAGRRFHLTHGDGMFGRDWAYAAFRKIVRTRASIVLAKLLHPELLFALSTWLSGHSRSATRDEAHEIEDKARRWLLRQHEPDWDVLVMGHVHHPMRIEAQGRELVCLGGWLGELHYGVLRDGQIYLDRFPAAAAESP